MEEGTAAGSGNQSSPVGGSAEQDETDEGAGGPLPSVPARDQDMCLPIANISRIMRRALPANAKVAKEAKECVQECITEFIGFITSEANDRCLQEKRKTISGDDVIFALTTLGFDNYVEPLKLYLHRYRELEGDNRPSSGSRSGLEPHKNDERSSVDVPQVQH